VIRLARQSECMGEKRNAFWVTVRKYEVNKFLEDLGIDERIILNCVLDKSYLISRAAFICLRLGTSFVFL
jgi:hypothetical protein